MKRKFFKVLLPAGAVLLSFIVVSGYGYGNGNIKQDRVTPNHLTKSQTQINPSEINVTINEPYRKIPAEVRKLTFIEHRPKDDLVKNLFLTPDKDQKADVKTAAAKLFK